MATAVTAIVSIRMKIKGFETQERNGLSHKKKRNIGVVLP